MDQITFLLTFTDLPDEYINQLAKTGHLLNSKETT